MHTRININVMHFELDEFVSMHGQPDGRERQKQ